MKTLACWVVACCVVSMAMAVEPEAKSPTAAGDKMLAEYFNYATTQLEQACLADIKTLTDWNAKKANLRHELLDMLGLHPLPEKTNLQATITGQLEHEEFVVEKVHFQSRPGLYVTGNLYRPKVVTTPLPTILYVCGHGASKKGNVSFGNKVSYQHHGAWFARNGYVCLVIDTLQMGEIEGIHHGTHRYGMWWWANVGYTPAGVEAWNCVRALDYLETRPEVDKTKFGVTGRSGGGAYSWWIAAIDDRIQCAVPVAGITDLRNHVVDGCVEGHCDCMYQQNTYRWDYGTVAALVAPRALMISNTDHDPIFPLSGVSRTYLHARRIYDLHKAADKLGFNITPGDHKDTQELQVAAFRWINKHLKGSEAPIEKVAVKYFEPEQLRVFQALPPDEINTKIQESFTTLPGKPVAPKDVAEWKTLREGWLKHLREQTFRAWPQQAEPLQVKLLGENTGEIRKKVYEFTSQGPVRLKMFIVAPADEKTVKRTHLTVMDEKKWEQFLTTFAGEFRGLLPNVTMPAPIALHAEELGDRLNDSATRLVYIAPLGVGPTAFDKSEKKQVQNRRRFQLLGETLQSHQVYDVRRAIQAFAEIYPEDKSELTLHGVESMSTVALFAAIFEPKITQLHLAELPPTFREGCSYFNVQRTFHLPQALAVAAEQANVVLQRSIAEDGLWSYPQEILKLLNKPEQLKIYRLHKDPLERSLLEIRDE